MMLKNLAVNIYKLHDLIEFILLKSRTKEYYNVNTCVHKHYLHSHLLVTQKKHLYPCFRRIDKWIYSLDSPNIRQKYELVVFRKRLTTKWKRTARCKFKSPKTPKRHSHNYCSGKLFKTKNTFPLTTKISFHCLFLKLSVNNLWW